MRGENADAFYGKRWMIVAGCLIFGLMTTFAFVMAPLFYFRIMVPADGRDPGPGIVGLSVSGVLAGIPFIIAVTRLITLREPIIRISHEGVTIRLLGRSAHDGVRFIPAKFRFIWYALSFEWARIDVIQIAWDRLTFAEARNTALFKWLIVGFQEVDDAIGLRGVDPLGTGEIAFEQSHLADPVEECAAAIAARAGR